MDKEEEKIIQKVMEKPWKLKGYMNLRRYLDIWVEVSGRNLRGIPFETYDDALEEQKRLPDTDSKLRKWVGVLDLSKIPSEAILPIKKED